jgi:hypothetical protein
MRVGLGNPILPAQRPMARALCRCGGPLPHAKCERTGSLRRLTIEATGTIAGFGIRPLLEGRPAVISFITVAELRYGAKLAGWGTARLVRLDHELSRADTGYQILPQERREVPARR